MGGSLVGHRVAEATGGSLAGHGLVEATGGSLAGHNFTEATAHWLDTVWLRQQEAH
jgi:hypothetical protein